MKIGVVSDTHSKELPQKMLSDFKAVDLIIHAGDFCSLKDYDKFAKLKDVRAVYGNMDDGEIRKLLPRRQIVRLGDVSVGLFHGEGPAETILETVKSEFKKDKVDLVIFGHSHQPFNEKQGGIIYFNPGSPNDTIFAPYQSYGMVEISGKNIKTQIVKVE